MESVFAALISAVSSIAVCIINSNVHRRKLLPELEKRAVIISGYRTSDYSVKAGGSRADRHTQETSEKSMICIGFQFGTEI